MRKPTIKSLRKKADDLLPERSDRFAALAHSIRDHAPRGHHRIIGKTGHFENH